MRNTRATSLRRFFAFVPAIICAFWAATATAGETFITVASTTSTANSGLFDHLLPAFERQHGVEVRVVAVGTGQALRIARNGDADVLLVHHRPSEEAFVADGYGVSRLDLMYNDFVLVGPVADPARIGQTSDVAQAFRKIAASGAIFASRGDDSGTHKAERALWRTAGVDTPAAGGDWYRETGAGMGTTLNIAVGLDAYTLSDRATWIAHKNKGDLALLFQGDRRLFNQYGVILVSPRRHPHVKATEGQAFVDWLVSDRGQAAIAAFAVDGQQLFFPNAVRKPGS